MSAPTHFSSSAADDYAACPRRWSYRRGPHRGEAAAVAAGGPPRGYALAGRRGRVLHQAIAAALCAARDELAPRRTPLAGSTLARYWAPARTALGQAWVREQMPDDPDEARLCTDLLARTLAAVPLPRPGVIRSIEEPREHVTAEGVAVRYVIDYAWWPDRHTLHITDWKSGAAVDLARVGHHRQLLRYAVWEAEQDPRIRQVEIELFALRQARGQTARVNPERAARAAARFDALAAAAAADPDPQPRPGRVCGTCPFTRVCPAAPFGRGVAA